MTQSTMRKPFQLTMFLAFVMRQAACQQQDCRNTSFSESEGVVTSPNFPLPYPHNVNCTYSIDVGRNNSVILKFREFDLEPPLHGNCTRDWLMISCNETDDENLEFGKRHCGNDLPRTSLRFVDCPVVVLKFFADSSVDGGGFSIEYTVQENSNSADIITDLVCGDIILISDSSRVIRLPANPTEYSASVNCTYTVSTNQSSTIAVGLLSLRRPQLLDSFVDCNSDHIKVGCVADRETELNPNRSSTYCRHSFDDIPVPPSRVVFSNCSKLKLSIRSSDYTFRGDDNFPVTVFPYDEECGPATFAGPTGIVTSPSFPLSYPHDLNCAYYIDVDRTKTVRLSFLSFNLEGTSRPYWTDICDGSWLTVSCLVDGVSALANPHQNTKYCGEKLKLLFMNFSNCDSLTVNFVTSSDVSKGDFEFRYTIISPGNATPTHEIERSNASFTGPSGFITSPGFPLSYPHNADYVFTIEVNPTSTVGLFSYSFNLEGTSLPYQYMDSCPYDWLSITCLRAASTHRWITSYCGEKTEPLIRSYSSCYSVTLNFISDSSVASSGFKIWYTIIPPGQPSCGNASYSGPSGLITSPNFPQSYPVDLNCTYSIDVGRNSTALLKLIHFDLEEPDSEGRCTNDWLLITCNGTTTENPNKKKIFCGSVIWSSSLRFVDCYSLVLEFFSGPSVSRAGFLIEYTVTENSNSTDEDSELDCGATLFTDSSGAISLPANPKSYLAKVNCTYTILTNHTNVIWLNFTITSKTQLMQSFQDCDRESLTVGCASAGETEVNPNRTRVYCRSGGSTPRQRYYWSSFEFTDCHTLKLSIRSNAYDNREAFRIPFAVYEPGEECGNTSLSDSSGIIYFPRLPFHYPRSVNCVYTIDNSLVKLFVLMIDHLNFQQQPSCDSAWLTITCVMVDGTPMTHRRLDRKLCTNMPPTTGIFPECRWIIIQFSRNYPSYNSAFKIRYRMGDNYLDCGTTLFTNTSGVISFPINPSNTLASVNCTYIISARSNLSYIWLDTVLYTHMELLQSFQDCSIENLTVGCVSERGTELNPITKKSICSGDGGSTIAQFLFANCSTVKLSILSKAYDNRRTFVIPYSFAGPDEACGNTSLPTPTGVVSSPRLPFYFGNRVTCRYTLDIGEVAAVSLSLDILDTDTFTGSPCSRAWLMITCLVNGMAMAHPLANRQLCGHMYAITARFPACRTVHFSYFTDSIYSYSSRRFSIRYKAGDHVLDCGTTLFTNSSGVINLPKNTMGYPATVNCTYTISANQLSHIWLTNDQSSFFQSFQDCDREILTIGCISEGETELNPNQARVFCRRQPFASNLPKTHLVFSDCATLKLSIRSDAYQRRMSEIPFSVVRPNELCGNTSFSAPTGTVSSPRLPQHYPTVVNCLYVIQSDHVDSVALNIDRLPAGSCDVNWLTISCLVNGTSMTHPMADRKLCGSQNLAAARFSACGSVLLNFSSDYSAYETGFTVRYRIGEYKLDCGTTLFTNSSGVINLPRNPTHYPATVNCTYTISAKQLSHIWLNTDQGSLAQFVRSFQDCDRDSVTFGCLSEGETEMNRNTTRVFCHRGGSPAFSSTWRSVFIDCPTLTLSISSNTYDRPMFSIPFTVFGASELCGNTSFSAQNGIVASPRLPQGFSKVVDCLYVIENDHVNTVVLNIDRLNVGFCNVNWLTITCLINETVMAHPMADKKLCGNINPTVVRFPACRSVLLNFSSDYSSYQTGFSMRYRTGDYDPECGHTSYSGPTGFITSPQFPLSYAHGLNCLYSIAGGQRKMISLSFFPLSLEGSSNIQSVDSCCCDWVTVSCLSDAAASPDAASSRKYCGVKTSPLRFSFPSCAVLVLNFRSDSSVNGGGFKVHYIVRDMDFFCGVSAYGPPSGVISLPSNFTDFDDSIECKYVINATEPSSISLTIWSISLQSSVRTVCSRDWLLITSINDQIAANLNTSHKSCDNQNTSVQLTFPGCTAVQVLFHKDAELTGKTFHIEYTVTSRETSQTAAVASSTRSSVTRSLKCEVGCEISTDGTTCDCSTTFSDTERSESVSVSTESPVTRSVKCEVGCEISKDGAACNCSDTHLDDTLVDTQINLTGQRRHVVGISLTVIVLLIGAICVGAFLVCRQQRQKKRSQLLMQEATEEDRAKMELEAESTKTGLLFGAHRNRGQDGCRYLPLKPMSTSSHEKPSSSSNSAQNLSEIQPGL